MGRLEPSWLRRIDFYPVGMTIVAIALATLLVLAQPSHRAASELALSAAANSANDATIRISLLEARVAALENTAVVQASLVLPAATKAPLQIQQLAELAPAAGSTDADVPANGRFRLHLASYREFDNATAGEADLWQHYPAILGSHRAMIEDASVGADAVHYYRIMAAGFATATDAAAVCAQLAAEGQYCAPMAAD